jgi:lysylphosphatidylglycerol synthetase-like protein (DUF2156 family)
MKFLSYVVFTLSIFWLLLVGFRHLLWLFLRFASVPESLWWLVRFPLPSLNAPYSWPIAVGGFGALAGAVWHAYLVREEKRKKEGSEV